MTVPPNLRVGIDGFNLALPHGTGVATYARTLAEAMRGLGRRIDLVYGLTVNPNSTPNQRETLFYAALAEGHSGGEAPERVTPWGRLRRNFLNPAPCDLIEIPLSGRVVRRGVATRVPDCDRLFTFSRLFYVGRRYLQRYGRLMPVRMAEPPAIMHWTYPVPVRLLGARNVYTIHDLVPLRLPYLSLEDKSYHERLLRACISSGDHVLTVSESSRSDILTYLEVPAEKVTTIHQAVTGLPGLAAVEEADRRRLRALFDLEPQGYFLFYGATEPKKNVGRLIEGYFGASIDTPLVIAGPTAWLAEGELRLLGRGNGTTLTRSERVRRVDYLTREHLGILLRGARGLVFPSIYEGFGLPPVEAMQAGVPVIAGDAGALPEILGDAGLLVDPYDPTAIGEAMTRIDVDPDLRAELISKGRRRAAAFALEPYQKALARFHAELMQMPTKNRSSVSTGASQ